MSEAILENEEQTTTINKTAIKEFATSARRKLIERVEMQALRMGFDKNTLEPKFEFEDDNEVKINGHIFNKKQVNDLSKNFKDKGFDTVIDEVAYTWFNRFIALYFMEVHNYIDNGLNIISSLDEINSIALKAPSYFKNINKEHLFTLVQDNKTEEVYKMLVVAQCNELSAKLPFLFEQISDYTELLFPQGMLNNDSVIREMLALDKNSWNEVEIIGWLYQYYNQAEKDRVIQAKKRYKKNEIPFATQLFTPKWIVKYMTQNSLGRLWQESKPYSNLKDDMEFYLEPRNLTEEDKKELEEHILKNILPENIKVFDPACGSGHILVYAYSLLYKMYQESGYIQEEIPLLILKNNLFGLDLCKRASQLAQLAVLLRAREDDKQIFNKYQELNIRCIENSKEITNEEIAFVAEQNSGEDFDKIKEFVECFENADIYGSLCKLPSVDCNYYFDKIVALKNKMSESLFLNSTTIYNKFLPLFKQFKIMQQQYECIITNPPYMGNKYMETKLAEFVQKNYPSNKSDLFSAFMEYIPQKTIKNGQIGLVTPFVWMFNQSYEKLRNQIINSQTLSSIIQLEYNAFEAACVPVATFTLRNSQISYPAECVKLSEFTGAENQPIKTLEAIKEPNVDYRFTTYSKDFHSIPGAPIAYWADNKIRGIFKKEHTLNEYIHLSHGMSTSDNNRFMRYWYEVEQHNIGFNFLNNKMAYNSSLKWFPYNKGGEYRKWYGNFIYLVNWQYDGREIKNISNEKYPYLKGNLDFVLGGQKYFFKEGITWTLLSSSNFGVRYLPNGFLFDANGRSGFLFDNSNLYYILGFMASKLSVNFLEIMCPAFAFTSKPMEVLPLIITDNKNTIEKINKLVQENIQLAKNDWDSFETSWDFEQHPLIRFRTLRHPEFISGSDQQEILKQVQNDNFKVQESFNTWKEYKEQQFNQLKANEEELNRLFIEIYGLQDEMTPEVADKDITVALAEEERDIKSLLSYAVGCMFGRYSLDEKGLVFAGGEFDLSKYKTLEVDEDGILPILSDTWFEDDIVEEFKRFLKKAFGELYFNENMQYIASVLSGKSCDNPEKVIRNYYLKDFYKDHLQTYKKRPIYWMFTSGKEKAFNCLVYLHRYDKTTLSRIRKDYLHKLQAKLDSAIIRAEEAGDVKLSTQYAKDKKELLDFDAKIKDYADEQIELDLDDGVKVNYAKFRGLLEAEKDIIGKEKK